MKYAYLENGIVVDRVGNDPFQLFQHAYASQFIECPEEVDHFWTFDGENWYPPQPKEPTQEERAAEVQASLDAFAREKDFDSINDACSYDHSTNIEWADQAKIANRLRDETWQAFYANKPLPELTWV